MKKPMRLLLKENFVFEFGVGLFGPIYAIYVQSIGGSILDAGLAWAVFLICVGLFEIPVAKYLDKFKMKHVLIVTTILSALSIMAYVFVSNMYQLFLLQAFRGLVDAVDKPAWTSWYSQFSHRTERGHDFALASMTNKLASGIAVIIGAAIAQFMGFSALFVVGGLVVLSSGVFLIGLKK